MAKAYFTLMEHFGWTLEDVSKLDWLQIRWLLEEIHRRMPKLPRR